MSRGKLDIIKFLVAKGAHIDAIDIFESTSLSHASQYGHLDIVKFLIKKMLILMLKTKEIQHHYNWTQIPS